MASLKDLKTDPNNARKHNPRNIGLIETSIRQVGAARSGVIDENGLILAGNGTYEALAAAGIERVKVVEADGNEWVVVKRTGLSEEQKRLLALADNRSAELAEWDGPILAAQGLDLAPWFTDQELAKIGAGGAQEAQEGPDPQWDRAEALVMHYGVALGQIWQLGDHRLACGDSTNKLMIEKLMQKQKAVLCCADPPYGMGKESEGIANDNLYAAKLDHFQMQWWNACRPSLHDNASAYIWGNAEDLWRLWYIGGLKASERLTFRNEIIWDKREDNPTMLVSGVPLENRRMYQPTERCFFFMLGEQGFNTNADNYWEGWEPIRKYLDEERLLLGWTTKQVASWFGFHPRMTDHWFSQSQWSFPLKEQYERLQREAGSDAFKRDYDDLKRDYDDLKRDYDDLKQKFYATRAYFDNTHDAMTDVWDCRRVEGEERYEHPTPKPVILIARMIKTSSPLKEIIYDPFLGSGTTLIACEQLNRRCFAMEISPAYVAVAIQRWVDLTGKEPRCL